MCAMAWKSLYSPLAPMSVCSFTLMMRRTFV